MISAIQKINKCVSFIHDYQLEKLTGNVVCLPVPIMFMKCDALSVYSILSINLSCFLWIAVCYITSLSVLMT